MSSVNSAESLRTLQWDMIELASHLRQERLFVNAEQQNLQALNEKVLHVSSDLAQQAWVTARQRVNLNQLIVARPDFTPAYCCQRANTLENCRFIDGYKHFHYQTCLAYGEFLCALRKSPKLLASCLVQGDKINPEIMQDIIQSLAAGLYGSALLPEDKMLVLKLLRHLMYLQVIPSDNPRRLLRHGTCAFSRFYSVFHENLFSAKLFLTAALHGPIMQLLMEDEMFLDIDPDKASIRFPPQERLKKFGKEGTPEYQQKLQRYRQWTVNSLFRITQRFIVSIRENMHCFPTSVYWLVRQMAGLLSKNDQIDVKEVHAICTDLVFTYFICPAIVNPEPYGITDAPVSYVARFNLMQIGQILQMLSLIKYQQIDPKVMDLYKKFDKDSVSSLLDAILEGASEDLEDEPTINENNKLKGLSRSTALFSENELNCLITFLLNVNNSDNVIGEDSNVDVSQLQFDKKLLNDLLSQLPSEIIATHTNGKNAPYSLASAESPGKRIASKGKYGSRATSNHSFPSNSSDGVDESNGSVSYPPEDESSDKNSQDVLVIPFSPGIGESVGMLSEQKILRMGLLENDVENGSTHSSIPDDMPNGHSRRGVNMERIETQEKRTRFSLSHDEDILGESVLFEGSIGNTSDNLEAVSEAASNHSVTSSLELETEDQNDNLSDMVSANVSGRGTPNISGRDTPSSQITEGDEGRGAGELRQLDLPPPNMPTKQSRSEIDDKFCKFEIKKLIEGDETVSMVSDTWSTDVLASDSEIVEQHDRIPYPAAPISESVSLVLSSTEPIQTTMDTSETASEAWSTDVLASDSERLTEVDTDDTASVARSDDTTRSEIEIENARGIETEDNTVNQIESAVIRGIFHPNCEEPHRSQSTLTGVSSTAPIQSPFVSNVSGRGGTTSDYRTNTLEYVDKNANNIGNTEYGKSIGEDAQLAQLMDQIHITDSGKGSAAAAAAAATAVTPALLLANRVSCSSSAPNEKVVSLEDCMNASVGNNDVVVRLSTASLASSSSSGSDCRLKNNNLSTPELLPSTSMGACCADTSDGPNSNLTKSACQGSSAGAIPKSISFDMTAERGDKELLDEDQKNKRGFFGKLKMSLRNRRGKSIRGSDDLNRYYEREAAGSSSSSSSNVLAAPSNLNVGGDNIDVGGRQRLRRILSEDVTSSSHLSTGSIDDILAKYRRKTSTPGDTIPNEDTQSRLKETAEDERLFIDPNNVETSFAFTDAERKLRMVLSTADLQHIPWCTASERVPWLQKENDLVAFLQLQLAEAINLQDRALIAHLHETLRCVRLFNDDGCKKLFESLRKDYQKRSPYIAYLIRCRQGLLSTLAHLNRLGVRIKCDRDAVNNHLVSVCVRVFLEKKENLLSSFCDEFKNLKLADEKQDLVDNFLGKIYNEMDNDPIWQAASKKQLELAATVVERIVMARVYHNALYPNSDGDIYRDQLLHDHIKKLAKVVTPNHKDLRIPKIYHYECPWPWAQAELAVISAYKTPRDKLQCVFRCATTIMNLLSMASERGVPAADDLIPVLVYVIIKTNPPSLLSTIQYVDSFYGNRLEGEEQYWWTQFCSAIEFIKTMD